MPRPPESTRSRITALFAVCLPLAAGAFAAVSERDAVELEVIRDTWGVPHVYGPTDASVVYGAAWAQAEDNWPQVGENFLRAIGRGAELLGEGAIADDYLARALEIPWLSMREYENAPADMRALYDAFAAGFNDWLERDPEAVVRTESGHVLMNRVEPWYTLALIRFKYHHNEYLGYAGLRREETRRLLEENLAAPAPMGDPGGGPTSAGATRDTPLDYGRALDGALAFTRPRAPDGTPATGSNEWAVAGSRTASGAPMLLINPHVSFFGLSQYTEVDLDSSAGLRFSGLSRFGFMLPYMGNGDRHGWAYTDNYGDFNDLYWLTLDEEGARYRYAGGWRDLERWTETLLVADGERVDTLTARFARSHHGGVVGVDAGGRPLAARLSKLREGGWFEQWYRMMRADSRDGWIDAVTRLNVPYMNTMYADRDGNIGYIYNHAVPRRSEALDWSRPVDGSDPAAEWDGYHSLAELPQYWNPDGGWLQNTNSDPLRATPDEPLPRSVFPGYMIGSETHNARAVSSVRVLETLDDLTLDDFAEAVLDTRLSEADRRLPVLFEEFDLVRGQEPDRARPLAAAIDTLRNWDRTAAARSVATTLFVRTAQRTPDAATSTSGPGGGQIGALEDVIEELVQSWGDWRVPWGEVNRLQRPDASGRAPFSDDLPSLPVDGAPGWLGSVFTYNARAIPEGRRTYGQHGNSFVKVVEFTSPPRARSIWVFGQSADPESPHYFDQAELYSERRFKPAWFTPRDVELNSERTVRLTYTPGAGTP